MTRIEMMCVGCKRSNKVDVFVVPFMRATKHTALVKSSVVGGAKKATGPSSFSRA